MFKAVRSVRHYYTLDASLHSEHGVKHTPTHTTNSQTHTRTTGEQDNGVCECGESAHTGLQAAAGAEEEEVFLGEDDVQEKPGQRRGVRTGRC